MGRLLLGLALLSASPERDALVALDVREAPVADIVGALAEAAGFQAVLDPGVGCRLTVRFTGVAYPEALANVLRACGLGYEAEGNVVRVATRARLVQEQAERRRCSRGSCRRGAR